MTFKGPFQPKPFWAVDLAKKVGEDKDAHSCKVPPVMWLPGGALGVQHPLPLPQLRRLCSYLPNKTEEECFMSFSSGLKLSPTTLRWMCLPLPRPCTARSVLPRLLAYLCEQQLRVWWQYRLPLHWIVDHTSIWDEGQQCAELIKYSLMQSWSDLNPASCFFSPFRQER